MVGTKRALLIASTYQGLQGPLHDVDAMSTVLGKWGFEITKCCGEQATYKGIMDAWKEVIAKTSSEDAVVIYYAGHGGLVEDLERERGADSTPARYQFIVPVDYVHPLSTDENLPSRGDTDTDSFKGILDVQISDLLYQTTQRTLNVTTIFDCCHSGRMARDPLHPEQAQVRSLGKVAHAGISRRVVELQKSRQIPSMDKLDADGNTAVVRIAATLSSLPAWENPDRAGKWAGRMTKALAQALAEALVEAQMESQTDSHSTDVATWKTVMAYVCEQVKIDFPQQHAHVDGPSTRQLFSLQTSVFTSFVLQMDDDDAILRAGLVSGVHRDNVYGLMPHGSERLIESKQLGRAKVTRVIGLDSLTELEMFPQKDPIPESGVLAFLEYEAFPKLPVSLPSDQELHRCVESSRYIRAQTDHEDDNSLARFWHNGDDLVLSTNRGVKLLSQNVSGKVSTAPEYVSLVEAADKLARAQHLVALVPDGADRLDHAVTVTIGKVAKKKPVGFVDTDGTGSVSVTDRIFILLHNESSMQLHASIFGVDVLGHISCVHSKKSASIELLPNRTSAVGVGKWGSDFTSYKRGSEWPKGSTASGIPLSWPEGISTDSEISDRLVIILTAVHVDLGQLASDKNGASRQPDLRKASPLERLASEIGWGTGRTLGQASEDRQSFAVIHIPLQLKSRELGIEELSFVEALPGYQRQTERPPPVVKNERVRDNMLVCPSKVG